MDTAIVSDRPTDRPTWALNVEDARVGFEVRRLQLPDRRAGVIILDLHAKTAQKPVREAPHLIYVGLTITSKCLEIFSYL